MHSWGFTLKEGVSQKPKKGFVETKIKKLAFKIQEELKLKFRSASRTSGCMELRAHGIETTTRQGWSSRRRQRGAPPSVRRVVGVRMRLLRHDGEVEGVVVEDDAVLVPGNRGCALLPKPQSIK